MTSMVKIPPLKVPDWVLWFGRTKNLEKDLLLPKSGAEALSVQAVQMNHLKPRLEKENNLSKSPAERMDIIGVSF